MQMLNLLQAADQCYLAVVFGVEILCTLQRQIPISSLYMVLQVLTQ